MHLKDPSLVKQQAYIDGQWLSSQSSETYSVDNPATGETIANVSSCGRSETARAIQAAEIALRSWRLRSASDRSQLLKKWHALIIASQDDLATIITTEQGKPITEARAEIAYGASYIEWFAEEARRVYGYTIPPPSSDKRLVVLRQPIGVVACITPWNFPNAMLARKIAPSLAAGCTVVCKPANETPLSALALAELAARAGIPAGVINVVSGNTHAIGGELTSNPIVRKLSFTGSTKTGKVLMAQCSETVKRTSMELGGNAPFIVFDDADIDEAVVGAINSKFRNTGQTCVCANRFLVQEGVHDEFVHKFVEASRRLQLGDGSCEGVSIGPMINKAAADNVRGLIDEAIQQGASNVSHPHKNFPETAFLPPTVLTEVTQDMQIIHQEIFGPVAPILKFSDEAEAVNLANATPLGLACYFYSRDMSRAWRVSEALEYGMVGINEGIISNVAAPFGGIKESGQGREGSRYGLDDYLETKYLCMGNL